MIIIFGATLLAISNFLMMLNYLICMMNETNREKNSTFECGFDPSSFARLPFSTHFFLIGLIFLIFDVEISLLIPFPISWPVLTNNFLAWLFISVILVLLVGALVEWSEESLEWSS